MQYNDVMRRIRFFGMAVCCLWACSGQAATVVSTETLRQNYFGVNLHLDNCCGGRYRDLKFVIDDLRYIGATRLRDWVSGRPGVLEAWQKVHAATGASFHASLPEAAPASQRKALAIAQSWLAQSPGLIDVIEGGNEEDTAYPKKLGASLEDTAELQSDVYSVGKAARIKVAQLSVGAGWAPPYYEGNYKKFGKPPADVGNAHVYMNIGSVPTIALRRIGHLAAYAVDDRPVDVTEFGFYRTPKQEEALTSAYMHIAPFASYLLGHEALSVYALYDDVSNAMGFYTMLGQPRAHAHYWHVTTQLLADPKGRKLPPQEMNITYADQQPPTVGSFGIKNVPMYKSDGSIWVATFLEAKAESAAGYQTVVFDKEYSLLEVIDGRTGLTVQRAHHAQKIGLSLPINHLFFVVAGKEKQPKKV
jgi:hypothetical protein